MTGNANAHLTAMMTLQYAVIALESALERGTHNRMDDVTVTSRRREAEADAWCARSNPGMSGCQQWCNILCLGILSGVA